MAEHKSLSQQPLDENGDGVETSTHQSMDSSQSTSADSDFRSDSQFEQGNAEIHGWDRERTSLTDFIERQFRPTIDISTLTAFGWLDRGSYASNNGRLISIPHGNGRMESVDTLLAPKSFLTRTTELAASRTSVADSFGRKMWNPIWLTSTVLLSFVVLFVGLFFLVLALYLYSEAHAGFM